MKIPPLFQIIVWKKGTLKLNLGTSISLSEHNDERAKQGKLDQLIDKKGSKYLFREAVQRNVRQNIRPAIYIHRLPLNTSDKRGTNQTRGPNWSRDASYFTLSRSISMLFSSTFNFRNNVIFHPYSCPTKLLILCHLDAGCIVT